MGVMGQNIFIGFLAISCHSKAIAKSFFFFDDDDDHYDDDDDDDGDDDDYDDDADDQMFTQTYSRLILDMII